MSSIRKIDKSDINLNKIYTTKFDAQSQTNSKIASVGMWDDNLEIKMTDDPNVGLVMKDGKALGYINLIDSDSKDKFVNNTDVSFDSDEFLKQQKSGAHNTKVVKPGQMSEDYEIPSDDNSFKGKNNNNNKYVTLENGNKSVIKPGMKITEEYEIPQSSNPTVSSHSQVPHIKSSAGIANYSQKIHSKKQATSSIKNSNGRLTTDNQRYVILPDKDFKGEKGTISESDYNLLVAQVAGEGSNEIDDMLGVTTTVLNRLESPDKNLGTTVHAVLEHGYFPWGRSYKAYSPGGKYYNTVSGQEKLAKAKMAVDDALNGYRNAEKNVFYYSGNGKYNSFSDIL